MTVRSAFVESGLVPEYATVYSPLGTNIKYAGHSVATKTKVLWSACALERRVPA